MQTAIAKTYLPGLKAPFSYLPGKRTVPKRRREQHGTVEMDLQGEERGPAFLTGSR